MRPVGEEEVSDFDDIVSRLEDVGKDDPIYVNIIFDTIDDEFKIVATNAPDQDTLAACLSYLLYQFAVGGLEYVPELDKD